MSDESFEEMMEKFQKMPGTAPSPPKVSQKEMEKIQKEGEKQVEELNEKLDRLEQISKYDPEDAKLEFFNIEYLLAQIPEILKTPKLMGRIKSINSKIKQHEGGQTLNKVDEQKKIHSEQLATPQKQGIGFEDISSEMGLAKSDEQRFMEVLENDEKIRSQEEPIGTHQTKAVSEEDEDLKNLQKLEKQESKDFRERDSSDSIGYLSATVDEIEKELDADQTKIDQLSANDELELANVIEKPPEEIKQAEEEIEKEVEKELEELDAEIKSREDAKQIKKQIVKNEDVKNPKIKKSEQRVEEKFLNKNESEIVPEPLPVREVEQESEVIKLIEPQEVEKSKTPEIRRVHVLRHKTLPLHRSGTNLIFGKQVHRDLSAGELYDNGMQYLNNREYQKAIQCFHGVIKRTPNNIAARIRLQEAEQKLKTL